MALSITRRRLVRYTIAALAALILLVAVAFSGVVFAWARFAHSLPALHGWHTSAPDAEFRASDAKDKYTFDDYLAQEAKVFAELDTFMTKDWAAEPAVKFNRYKPTSICNPATLFTQNWNRSFVLEAKNPIGGALLVHGLSDSPYSLRTLATNLHAAGYTVIGLRVPGHGTTPKALADADWQDWVAATRVAMTGLRSRVPANLPVIMVGYSNGGALCINHVASALLENDKAIAQPSAIVLFSPMIGISPMAEFTELYPTVAKLSGEKKLAWSAIQPEIDPFKYSSWPISASLQAYRLTRHLERTITTLAADGRMKSFPPVLTVQSAADSTVIAYRMIDILMDRLPQGTSELLLFDINRTDVLDGLADSGFEKEIRDRLTRGNLPFDVTVVTNRHPDAPELIARTFTQNSITQTDLPFIWPRATFSLSHVALPIPPSDPIYGIGSPEAPAKLPLGTLSLRGESGVLAIAPSLMMRMRYNPFYDWTEQRVLTWIKAQTAAK